MATYAEFLKANGATDEDIKILDTPVAQRAYTAQLKAQSDADAAHAAAIKKHNDEVQKWYNEQLAPALIKTQRERDTAMADAAAAAARVKALQEQGLLEVEEKQKQEEKKIESPDLSKYVTSDTLNQIAEREGDAIAAMADIQDEHRELFGTRLNARELRKEALAQRKSVEEVWLEKYKVQAKRDERAAADKAAYETKLRDEGAAAERAKLQTSNPNLLVPTPSRSPFTGRLADPNAPVQPWNRSEAEKTSGYVDKVLKNPELQKVLVQ